MSNLIRLYHKINNVLVESFGSCLSTLRWYKIGFKGSISWNKKEGTTRVNELKWNENPRQTKGTLSQPTEGKRDGRPQEERRNLKESNQEKKQTNEERLKYGEVDTFGTPKKRGS